MREELETKYTFPLDDADMAKIALQMEESWHLDNKLLRSWSKARDIILLCFRLAGGHALLKSLISRETRVDSRSLQFFISVGWLSRSDFKIIADLQFWSNMVIVSRPNVLRSEQIKSIDRDAQPMREVRSIEGSILTSPPAPAEGQVWLKGLIAKADTIIPALRNCEKRLGKRDGVKALAKANDPNMAMRDAKETHTPMPEVPNGHFVAGYG